MASAFNLPLEEKSTEGDGGTPSRLPSPSSSWSSGQTEPVPVLHVDPSMMGVHMSYQIDHIHRPKRSKISREQQVVLLKHFENEALPNFDQRQALSKVLGMTPRSVQIWFQNRRQRLKPPGEPMKPPGDDLTQGAPVPRSLHDPYVHMAMKHTPQGPQQPHPHPHQQHQQHQHRPPKQGVHYRQNLAAQHGMQQVMVYKNHPGFDSQYAPRPQNPNLYASQQHEGYPPQRAQPVMAQSVTPQPHQYAASRPIKYASSPTPPPSCCGQDAANQLGAPAKAIASAPTPAESAGLLLLLACAGGA